jgi:adenylate kinase
MYGRRSIAAGGCGARIFFLGAQRPSNNGAQTLRFLATTADGSAGSPPRTLRLIIIGPPGGGKGTQGERIERDYGLSQISTGQLLRAERDKKSPLGQCIEEIVAKGGLVADDVMFDLVKNAISSHPNPKGWLLDGFPRTTTQAQALKTLTDELGKPITGVLYINADKNVIADRLKDRYIHPGSGRSYNLRYYPPKVPGKDDLTGEDLVQREDDKPETVLSRLTVYEEKTRPVLDYYARTGLLHTIDSPNSDIGYERIKQVLNDLLRQ